jgi:hypothetical protein
MNNKTQKSIHTFSIRRLLLIVPVTSSMAFAACSKLASTAGTHPIVNHKNAAAGGLQARDNVTTGPTRYNLESQSVEIPQYVD